MQFKINDNLTASGQIQPADIQEIKEAGFTTIVCARPDGEVPGQPSQQEIGDVARTAGLRHVFIPVERGKPPTLEDGATLASLMADGPVFAYCGAGPRIGLLYAAAAASSRNVSVTEVESEISQSGLTISNVGRMMQSMTRHAA